MQPKYHFNAPVDIRDGELKELAAETKKKKVNQDTGEITYAWVRSARHNELWDLLMYNAACVEILAAAIHQEHGRDRVSMSAFYDAAEQRTMFFAEPHEGSEDWGGEDIPVVYGPAAAYVAARRVHTQQAAAVTKHSGRAGDHD